MKADRLISSILLVLLGVVAKADDRDSNPSANTQPVASEAADGDARLREIIEQVRRAEERYSNLETVVHTSPAQAAEDVSDQQNAVKNEETCYTVQQGDLFLFKWRQVQTMGVGEPIVTEQIAAFDGETTRSVVHGNCVNIFAGRHEPSRLYPPHTWCLQTLWVNYPLSVYLQGTAAIKKHPKSFKSPFERGRSFEIARVEVSYMGEESVDGLECVKLQSRHWNRERVTPQITEAPKVAQIWLARDRGYLCARVNVAVGQGFRGMMRNETKVTEWNEIQPGFWLPKQIQTTHYIAPQNGGDEVVSGRESVLVEEASPDPKHPRQRFADVKPPEGLPIYKLDRDGFLEGSAAKSAKAPAGDRQELVRIIAELKRQEEALPAYDLSTTATYGAIEARKLGPGFTTTIEETERTISLPGKLYNDRVERRRGSTMVLSNAAPVAGRAVAAPSDTVSRSGGTWDGQWISSSHSHSSTGDKPTQSSSTSLQRGGPKGLIAFRPHTAIFSDDRMRRRPLSDFLTAEYWDEINRYRYLVEYMGDEDVDGLQCAKLRLGGVSDGQKEPTSQFFFLWLARERNYLPVRSEHVELAWSDRIPTSVAQVDDLREVAPGAWFPYHVVEVAHETIGPDGVGSGQVLVHWRRERQVESLDLRPDAPDDLFTPTVAAGTWVYLSDERSNRLGRFRQRKDGVPAITPDKFAVMEEIARIDWRDHEDQKRRQAARDALVGKPLPDFGDGTWLNGEPQTTESLRGKVLLIEFWADWWQSSENDLKKLAAASRGLAAEGVTVIGVHTAGSDRRDIQDLADEVHFDDPIFIDRGEPAAATRWGKMFEKLAVRELPYAFVVDRGGKIVAHGGLDKMIAQAFAQAAEK